MPARRTYAFPVVMNSSNDLRVGTPFLLGSVKYFSIEVYRSNRSISFRLRAGNSSKAALTSAT